MAKTEFRPTLGGVAVVCCVHDREKRQVTTERHVAKLGEAVGIKYDPKIHRLNTCACCENLFVVEHDEPAYCSTCRPSNEFIHMPAAPLNPPTEGQYG